MHDTWAAGGLWLVRVGLGSSLLMLLALVAMRRLHQPARRQRLGEFAVAASLVLAIAGLLPSWLAVPWHGSGEASAPVVEHPALAPIGFWTAIEPPAEEEMLPPPAPEPPAPEPPPAPRETILADCVPWLVAAYAAGAAFFLVRWLMGHVALFRVLRRATPVPADIVRLFQKQLGSLRLPRMLMSRSLRVPASCGILRPTIILPVALCRPADAARLPWVFAHEWTHLERGDAWSGLLFALARMLFFPLPWFWALRRQVRLCQEYVADAAALQGSPADLYAEFLLSWTTCPAVPVAATGVSGNKSDLFRRVSMLLNRSSSVEKRCPRVWTLAIGASLVTLGVVLGGVGPTAQAQDPDRIDVIQADAKDAGKPGLAVVEFKDIVVVPLGARVVGKGPELVLTLPEAALTPPVVTLPEGALTPKLVTLPEGALTPLIVTLPEAALTPSRNSVAMVTRILGFKPRLKAVEISTPTPEEYASCEVRLIKGNEKGSSGWLLLDAKKRPLRFFFDSNGDKKVDIWSYFKDGVEIYREIDKNFTGRADQYQLLAGGEGNAAKIHDFAQDDPSDAKDPARKRSKIELQVPAIEPNADRRAAQPVPLTPGLERLHKMLEELKRQPVTIDIEELKKMVETLKARQPLQTDIEDLKKLVEQLQAQQPLRSGRLILRLAGAPERLGINVTKPSEALSEQLNLAKGQGLLIAKVTDDSPAAKAGLKVNDILLKFNNKTVPNNVAAFHKHLESVKPNVPVDVVVLRKGKEETVKGLQLPEAPAPVPLNLAPRFDFKLAPPAPPLPLVPVPPLGGRPPGAPAPAGGHVVMTTSFRTDNRFTTRYQEGSLVITLTGKVSAGKANPEQIHVQDGQTSNSYDSLSKVPAPYRDKVNHLIQVSSGTEIRREEK